MSLADHDCARIGDAGGAGVADQGDILAFLQAEDDLCAPFRLFFPVIADQRRRDPEVGEELPGVPGVLGSDEIDLLEDPQGPQGNVFEIADRGGHDEKGAGGFGGREGHHDGFWGRETT
ncbi:MAG: hypothetical protein ACD_75C02184G0001 [uncultured bacterium]|nr:MAG: hypothetical protein ACD_75C02184G0001 [uncultured bacterium]